MSNNCREAVNHVDTKSFRLTMEEALRHAGLEPFTLIRKGPKAWRLPDGEIVQFFYPHAIRRSWGFIYAGSIGIDIPALRQWLNANAGNRLNIFHVSFLNYRIENEDVLGRLWIDHGKSVPSDLWAGLLKDRLADIPNTVEGLLTTYRRKRDALGWLAHPSECHAWDFLFRWQADPDQSLKIPYMAPTGEILIGD